MRTTLSIGLQKASIYFFEPFSLPHLGITASCTPETEQHFKQFCPNALGCVLRTRSPGTTCGGLFVISFPVPQPLSPRPSNDQLQAQPGSAYGRTARLGRHCSSACPGPSVFQKPPTIPPNHLLFVPGPFPRKCSDFTNCLC